MISILLVEDEQPKRAAIAEIIYASGIPEDALHIASDVSEAKKKLTSKGFDLLLLDINLPKRADKEPEAAGGLEVLRWLKGRGRDHQPTYIVGTTAYGESFEVAQSEFDNFIWTIIAFSFSDSSWKSKLVATLGLICGQLAPPFVSDGVSFKTDIVILTALEKPELSAVLDLPVIWKPVPVRFDDSRYVQATYSHDGRDYSIVAVAASDKGLSSAAIAATKAIQAFRPRLIVMTGICAGVKGRTKLGDVVVADPSYDWGSGKERDGKGRSNFFQPAPYQRRLNETLRNKVAALGDEPDCLKKDHADFKGKKGLKGPKVHCAAFASGAAVLQSKKAVEKLVSHHKDLRAIDMEVYSVMCASDISDLPRPLSIAVKGVCDFGDSKKHDGYQKYAAFISARTLWALLPALLS